MAPCTTCSATTGQQSSTGGANGNTKAAAKAKAPVKAASKKKVNSAANVTKAFENGLKEITPEFPATGK